MTKLLEHWLPPDGAGAAVGCVATSFTFDADFFTQDCLSRFLQLSSIQGEGDAIADVALLLEEEEKLSEARVCVLADRSCNPESRNLRWDLLPVALPGGLLHAKATLLVWERATRIVIGSANLTPAGYRRQVELAAAFDVDEDCRIPGAFLLELLDELGEIVALAPGSDTDSGPKVRAREVLSIARQRVGEIAPVLKRPPFVVSAAPARPGVSPLDRLADVWRGTPPQSMVAMAPFWDTTSDRAVASLCSHLAKRAPTGGATSASFVVPVEQMGASTVVRAPARILSAVPARIRNNSSIHGFDAPDGDVDRRLHAKAVWFESETWVALMVGSSNMTEAGLGLHSTRGHRELNVWIGCANGTAADALYEAIAIGDQIEVDEVTFADGDDEDEDARPGPPLGFVEAIVHVHSVPTLSLTLDTEQLPDEWRVELPTGQLILDHTVYLASGSPPACDCECPSADLPSALVVAWTQDGAWIRGAWPVNVGDVSNLPPPSELRDLPADVLIGVLASTRPIRAALEAELRRRERVGREITGADLDPLKRFDGSALLLQRTRRVSAALWGMQQRMERPAANLDALDWRLDGSVGPLAIARKLVDEPGASTISGEALFSVAELALTVSRVDWPRWTIGIDAAHVSARVDATLTKLRAMAEQLVGTGSPELNAYVDAAFTESMG